jgi:hypothetical protein
MTTTTTTTTMMMMIMEANQMDALCMEEAPRRRTGAVAWPSVLLEKYTETKRSLLLPYRHPAPSAYIIMMRVAAYN